MPAATKKKPSKKVKVTTPISSAIRTMIVDDHPIVRQGLTPEYLQFKGIEATAKLAANASLRSRCWRLLNRRMGRPPE